jgi:ribonuclease J
MKICIHRGSNQVGGSCVEVECGNSRIILDVGLPLNGVSPEDEELPNVPGFTSPDPSLLGVIISHPHQDHYGLIPRINKDIPIIIGAAAQRILERASLFTGNKIVFSKVIHLVNEQPISIGPFRIIPFLMDHSAFDSYAILVEGDNKRLFYTGDLRSHGRKGSLFHKLVTTPPPNINVLLMEGTTVSRDNADGGFPSESDVENEMIQAFRQMHGMGLVMCSGQNIDRIVSIFKSCIRSGRSLIVDMYTAEVLRATENPNIPQAAWEQIHVFLPANQKMRIIKERAFDIANHYRRERIYPEDLKSAAPRSVMLFRPSMMRDLSNADCLKDAGLVYSMWDGYLKEPRMKSFLDWLDKWQIPMVQCHTSGHASVKDLQKLRDAFSEAIAVPIHTYNPERFKDLFGKVEIHGDGEWWQVHNK